MKNCNICKKDFGGRSNQRFCSTQCKNAFHNQINKVKEIQVKNINKILHKNWVTLQKLFEIYRSSPIGRNVIKAYGFNEEYHTKIYTSPNGESYKMIYDMAYKPYFDDQIQIVKLDD